MNEDIYYIEQLVLNGMGDGQTIYLQLTLVSGLLFVVVEGDMI